MATHSGLWPTTSGNGPTHESSPLVRGPGANVKRWFRSLNCKLKIVLAIGFISLLFVIVLVALSLRRASSPIGCTLNKNILHNPAPSQATWQANNATSMAKIAAYIEIYNEGYLPVNIKRMIVSNEEQTIGFEDECASISIGYHEENENFMSIMGLEWNFQRQDGATVEAKREYCTVIEPNFQHTFPKGERYACNTREVFQCRRPDSSSDIANAFAQLVIELFELELDGNSVTIREGRFSKEPYGSSCTT